MAEFIQNPRRVPRAPVRCEARIALADGGYWASPTSDYGPHGCQVLSPMPLAPGTRVFVELVNERVPEPVGLAGRVAWRAKDPPWRMGVHFDESSFGAAGGFFERLAAAYPGIDAYDRAPDRIPEDAPLAPAPPPESRPPLTEDEEELLVLVGAGARAGALGASFAGGRDRAVHAMFALLARRYLVVGEPDAEAAAAWDVLRRAVT